MGTMAGSPVSTGVPSGFMVSMVWKSCPAFSSSVMRASRSSVRSSGVRAGFW